MTQCERVLKLLSDRQPHSHHELYALGCVAHSRISELRSKGHTIEAWREGDLYLYRLSVLSETSASLPQAAATTDVSLNPECRAQGEGAKGAAEQLTLVTA